VAWVPYLHAPLSSDESGFLLLAQHWRPGSSLYGDYWVDRPPLLLWLFSLAGLLGHGTVTATGLVAPAVKLLGAVASGLTVLLSAVLTHLVAPRSSWSRRAAVVAVAALSSSPLLGMPETDGEVLAVPFVLLGLVLLCAARTRTPTRQRLVLVAGAGAAAAAAALVKQNLVDVFVFAGVAAVVVRLRGTPVRRPVLAFVGGATTVLAAALAGASYRGTSPAGLWDAVVGFRVRATELIGASASPATSVRLGHVVLAFVVSGAAALLAGAGLVVLAQAVGVRRVRAAVAADDRADDWTDDPARVLAWPALATAAWELCSVAAGGSYWLHYLTCTLPGVVLLLSVARPPRGLRTFLTLAVAYAVLASAATWAYRDDSGTPVSTDDRVVAFLRGHARPADGLVVAFGHPGIVAASGLRSPYAYLWALPVRVRDPHLAGLRTVLAGPAAPRWVVVAGESLGSWGIQADRTQHYLERHYVDQRAYGDWHVWERLGRSQP
jgi:hypothetical protein